MTTAALKNTIYVEKCDMWKIECVVIEFTSDGSITEEPNLREKV